MRKLIHRFAFALVPLTALTGCTSTPSQPATNATASSSSWSWMNPFAAKPANAVSSSAPASVPENDQLSLNKKPRTGSDLYLHTAKVYEQSNNFEAAKSQYDKALEIEPKNYDVLLAYAHMQDRAGKFEDAAKLYQRAIAAQPKQPTAYNDLGLCLARVNRYDESVKNLNKAIEMQPQKALYRNNLATVLVQQNKLQEAVTQLSAVNPPAVAHYNVAFLLQRRGDMNAATQHMVTAAQLDPNFAAARQWLQENQPTQYAQTGPAMAQPQYQQQQPQNSYSMAQAPSYSIQSPGYSAQPPVAQQLQYQQPQPGYQAPTQYAPPSYSAPQNSQPSQQYRPARGQENAPSPYPGFTPSARTRALNNQIQQASYEDAIEELSSEIPPLANPSQPTPRF